MISDNEKVVLGIISKRQLVRKSELSLIALNLSAPLADVINSLKANGHITSVNPIGEETFAISRKGAKELGA